MTKAKSSKRNEIAVVDADSVVEKAFNPPSIEHSIVEVPTVKENRRPAGPIVFQVATAADEFVPWGYDVKQRDLQLRTFWPTEPILASAVYSMSARLAVTDWEVIGADPTKPEPRNTKAAVETMLRNADYGQGWMSFISKLTVDVFTQDNGGFIELVRMKDDPASPVIAVNHLDSFRCYRTGDPEVPVLYQNSKGVYRELKWWNVVDVTEMPSPIEDMFNVQYSAVTRCLRAAQLIRDIAVYEKEKVSGQFMRTMHFLSGVNEDNIESAMALAREQQMNMNTYRYTQPAIVPTLDPDTTLSHIQVDLATLPDNFDKEISYKWYISQLALAFGVDYQEFAPLPGGNLGSGQQSEILHLKSRGKGPALLMSRLENIFNNFGILPRNVKFTFKVLDSRAESERAAARFERGKDRATRISSGELDPESARELAVKDGDIPAYLLDDINRRQEERKAEQQRKMEEEQSNAARVGMTNQQTQGGMATQMRKSYSDDDIRAQVIQRLQRRGELSLRYNVEITEEEINKEKKRLAAKMKDMLKLLDTDDE